MYFIFIYLLIYVVNDSKVLDQYNLKIYIFEVFYTQVCICLMKNENFWNIIKI